MKNANYNIHEVESNGDCFFAVIRDAFLQIGQKTTVAKLRAILAAEVNDTIFNRYRTLYVELSGAIKDFEKERENIKKIIEKDLKKRAIQVKTDKEKLNVIAAEVKDLQQKRKDLGANISEIQAIISESIGNMEGIDTIEKFREYVQTTSYWADDWAISTIEKVLNIKVIILSEQSFLDESEHSVLKCNIFDEEIAKKGIFTPNYYIMTTYSGNHYRLISYKNKKIFAFKEIPYHIKTLVINKCIERNSGVYYLIQDFRNFKSKLGIDPDTGAVADDADDVNADNIGELYDPNTTFMFYNKSEKKAKPGKGSGEKIPDEKINDFIGLSRMDNWRRKLDDDYSDAPFVVNGHRYASVEHYYQSAKFKKGFPDFSLMFSLDNDNEISKDVAVAKAAGSKTGKLKKDLLRPKNVVIDPDFYPVRNKEERLLGLRSKFSQNEDLRQLLLATKDAKLLHYVVKQPPELDLELMLIRKELLQR
jgi:predicted NAD-dependent protein-ADP-ribosyltransferase YbiA (DUF1768 family)